MIDNDPETCYQSDKSLNQKQTVLVRFTEEVNPKAVKIQFQGGFSASLIEEASDKIQPLHPEDSNKLQEFPLSSNSTPFNELKLSLTSNDFYGRLIIYHL